MSFLAPAVGWNQEPTLLFYAQYHIDPPIHDAKNTPFPYRKWISHWVYSIVSLIATRASIPGGHSSMAVKKLLLPPYQEIQTVYVRTGDKLIAKPKTNVKLVPCEIMHVTFVVSHSQGSTVVGRRMPQLFRGNISPVHMCSDGTHHDCLR